MAYTNDGVKDIEFFTTYPNKEGTYTLLATVITKQGYRALMYSPSVSKLDASMDITSEFEDDISLKHIPLNMLEYYKRVSFGGQVFAAHDRHNEHKWYFKLIYLDGPASKPSVTKEEVEKLFGCVIHG